MCDGMPANEGAPEAEVEVVSARGPHWLTILLVTPPQNGVGDPGPGGGVLLPRFPRRFRPWPT